MEEEKFCSRIGCGKPHNNQIRTSIGLFCSENCRKEIERNIFNFLIDPVEHAKKMGVYKKD